jgi:hypothetical protein
VPTALGISGVYSPLGLQVSDLLLRSRPEIVKQFGDLVQKQSAEIGGIGAPQTLFGYNRADRLPE